MQVILINELEIKWSSDYLIQIYFGILIFLKLSLKWEWVI